MGGDSQHLIVDAPEISNDAQSYVLALIYSVGSNVVVSLPMVTIYTCNVTRCKSCQYDTRANMCSECHEGFQISEDSTQ